MQQELAKEKQFAKEYVKHEFEKPWDHSDPVQRELHSGGAVEKVFGGVEATSFRELQLCQAWRPVNGTWELANGIIHRVHHDRTVTVQFLPDQHRCRLPFMSVKPHLDITPKYPDIVLSQGERLPTASEIEIRERNANVMRQQYGIGPEAQIPGLDQGHDPLGRGEHRDAEGHAAVWGDHWAIPVPTQDALRNRSVPSSDITGVYGRHFYTNLYKNHLGRPDTGHQVSQSGHVGLINEERAQDRGNGRVVSHTYIPLHGPELEQDMRSGRWRVAGHREEQTQVEGPGWFG